MKDKLDELICTCADSEVEGERTYAKTGCCESGGLYSMHVDCPHCDHSHDLL